MFSKLLGIIALAAIGMLVGVPNAQASGSCPNFFLGHAKTPIIASLPYTIGASDECLTLVFNSTTPGVISIPAPAGSFTPSFYVAIQNIGAGTLTLTPSVPPSAPPGGGTAPTINGNATLAITTGGNALLASGSDGNWYATTSLGVSGMNTSAGNAVLPAATNNLLANPISANINTSGTVATTNATASTSPSTGAAVVTGGLGVGGALNVGNAVGGTCNLQTFPTGLSWSICVNKSGGQSEINFYNEFTGAGTVGFDFWQETGVNAGTRLAAFYNNGAQIGSPAGGGQGAGTLNLAAGGIYDNGTAPTGAAGSGYVRANSPTITTPVFVGAKVAQATKTANYTVLSTDSGTHFDNTGAAGTVIFTLPAYSAGLRYCFQVTAAQIIEVLAPAATNIAVGTANSAAAGNIQNGSVYSSICVVATSVSNQWAADRETGFWIVN